MPTGRETGRSGAEERSGRPTRPHLFSRHGREAGRAPVTFTSTPGEPRDSRRRSESVPSSILLPLDGEPMVPGLIRGAEPIPLGPVRPTVQLGENLSGYGEQTFGVEYTAQGGGVKSGTKRFKVAQGVVERYADRHMGGDQHSIHVAADMLRHPVRGGLAILGGVVEVGLMAGQKVIRDAIEELWLPGLIELAIGKRFSLGRKPNGKFGFWMRPMNELEKTLVLLDAGFVYDAIKLADGILDAGKFVFKELVTLPKALREGPRHGYSIKAGRVVNKPNPPTFV